MKTVQPVDQRCACLSRRYNQHTKHCPECSSALLNLQRFRTALKLCALALGVAAVLTAAAALGAPSAAAAAAEPANGVLAALGGKFLSAARLVLTASTPAATMARAAAFAFSGGVLSMLWAALATTESLFMTGPYPPPRNTGVNTALLGLRYR
jgi:hypothetical protein